MLIRRVNHQRSNNLNMEKILVTTDFSDNSKAGVYFAIQLASQRLVELTFFHSFNILIPTSCPDSNIVAYEQEAIKKLDNKLRIFVDKIYKDLGVIAANYYCMVKSSPLTETNIMEYAKENGFSFICISTRGAGKLKRFFGTNTANIINYSDVPVIAVPSTWQTTKVERILYASDFIHPEKELPKVVAFATPLQASVALLHFTSPLHKMISAEMIEIGVKNITTYPVKLHIENKDPDKSMVANIEEAIQKIKPSMLIMFTEQNRTLFQKIFISAKSAEYSFNAKVPILVFNKA